MLADREFGMSYIDFAKKFEMNPAGVGFSAKIFLRLIGHHFINYAGAARTKHLLKIKLYPALQIIQFLRAPSRENPCCPDPHPLSIAGLIFLFLIRFMNRKLI